MTAGARKLWPAAAAGTAALLAALATAALMALFGASVSCLGGTAGALAAGPGSPAPGGSLGGIPAARLHIYEAAGSRFDLSPGPFSPRSGCRSAGPTGIAGSRRRAAPG